MAINSTIYTHELDRAALQTLQAIPGFTQLLKAFMKIWSEKQFHILNMSTNLRLSEKQMAKYYNMLPPICEKLGIEVPDLYLELDVNPNAYTSGDTKPFIVMTSGLLETMPEELIPTVLAHECGHIACHHVLYRTMGTMILNGAISLLGLNELVTFPLQAAFYYWMRCSEYSADRAAAICDGSADKVVEMCMRFAGYDKDIGGEGNVEAFMEQAIEYKELVSDSAWNKTLEFIMFNNRSHPLNAVRAYECHEWQNSETFPKIINYLDNERFAPERLIGDGCTKELPMTEPARHYLGKNYAEVQLELQSMGFTNFELNRVMDKVKVAKAGQVIAISIADDDNFARGNWFSADSLIVITYYEPATEEEIAAAHPGELKIPDSSKRYVGRNYQQVACELADAGFTNIVLDEQKVRKNWLVKEGCINWISIGGQTQFDKGTWCKQDAVIRITYQTFIDSAATPSIDSNSLALDAPEVDSTIAVEETE